MAKESFGRYRFSVPTADVSVNEWAAFQSNLSHSLRQLIKEHIQKYGIADATCTEVSQLPRRGRPPKSEFIMNQRDFDGVEFEDDEDDGLEPVVKIPTVVEPKIVQTITQPLVEPVHDTQPTYTPPQNSPTQTDDELAHAEKSRLAMQSLLNY